MEKRDKEKVIKVFGDRLFIDKQQFNWHDGKLWCGTKMGFNQLNSIFTCKFDEFSFTCLDENVYDNREPPSVELMQTVILK